MLSFRLIWFCVFLSDQIRSCFNPLYLMCRHRPSPLLIRSQCILYEIICYYNIRSCLHVYLINLFSFVSFHHIWPRCISLYLIWTYPIYFGVFFFKLFPKILFNLIYYINASHVLIGLFYCGLISLSLILSHLMRFLFISIDLVSCG